MRPLVQTHGRFLGGLVAFREYVSRVMVDPTLSHTHAPPASNGLVSKANISDRSAQSNRYVYTSVHISISTSTSISISISI